MDIGHMGPPCGRTDTYENITFPQLCCYHYKVNNLKYSAVQVQLKPVEPYVQPKQIFAIKLSNISSIFPVSMYLQISFSLRKFALNSGLTVTVTIYGFLML